MTERPVHGHTRSGRPITDRDIEDLAAEAEAGYDTEALIARRNKRGRPAIGNAPASVESVRLDPELRRQLLERAEAEGTTTSELIREALRRYLQADAATELSSLPQPDQEALPRPAMQRQQGRVLPLEADAGKGPLHRTRLRQDLHVPDPKLLDD